MKISRRAGNRSAMSNKTLFLSPHCTSPHRTSSLISPTHPSHLLARARETFWLTNLSNLLSHYPARLVRPVISAILLRTGLMDGWTDSRRRRSRFTKLLACCHHSPVASRGHEWYVFIFAPLTDCRNGIDFQLERDDGKGGNWNVN